MWSEIYRLRAIQRIFPLKCATLSFGKCKNYQISGFQRGDIFLILTILNEKERLKYFFSLSEPQRWALVG